MEKKWLIGALILGLLLTGCGKKDAEASDPVMNEPIPMLTEAPTWPSADASDEETTYEGGEITPLETEEGEDAGQVEAVTEETLPPETEPKADPDVDVVNETVYAKAHVNVRSGPGFNHKVVGTLEGGDSVTRTGIGKHGWSRITFEGKTAYVANNYVSPDSPETANGNTFQEVNQTVKATSKVNVRKGPGVDYALMGQLKAGEEVTRTGIGSKGWSRVKFDGKTCYVANNYLKVVSNTAVPESDG